MNVFIVVLRPRRSGPTIGRVYLPPNASTLLRGNKLWRILSRSRRYLRWSIIFILNNNGITMIKTAVNLVIVRGSWCWPCVLLGKLWQASIKLHQVCQTMLATNTRWNCVSVGSGCVGWFDIGESSILGSCRFHLTISCNIFIGKILLLWAKIYRSRKECRGTFRPFQTYLIICSISCER